MASKRAAKKTPRKKTQRRKTRATTASRTSKRARTRRTEFPDRLFAIASPLSTGGVSMFEVEEPIASDIVGHFSSDDEVTRRAVLRLQDAGFEVLQATSMMINIAGSRTTFEKAFGTKLVAEEREAIKEMGKKDKATFFDCPDTEVPGLISTQNTPFADVLEGVALEEPKYFMAPSAFAPTKSYWHLDVPGDVSLGCNADRAHRGGVTGNGINVAMVDSGWYKHPFFTGRGYRASAVTLGPGTANPLNDEVGHGTGESANVFAVAPDVQLLPVKAMLAGSLNTVLVNSTGAFNAAVGLNPDIITNSWGFSISNGPLSAAEQALAAAVAAAVASGIIVVFSAGNGHWGFPGQHPDVISAGGVFMDEDGDLRASDYSSGFMSNIYAGRRVPDLSGLVGMRPRAAYIMLPVEPGDDLDQSLAGGNHPNGDETANDDGWAAFSGTSAAAPQIAGAAALIKQACPRLTPADVKDILMRSARDVTQGRNHPNFNNQAVAGPDTATGNGLLDAHRAVLLAKLRCSTLPLTPIQPIQPVLPVQPIQPVFPVQPVAPIRPIRPVLPVRPIRPIQPLQPVRPIQPISPLRPIRPLQPLRPIQPIRPLPPRGPGVPMTEEDVEELENLILSSGDDT